jgi:LemA protein
MADGRPALTKEIEKTMKYVLVLLCAASLTSCGYNRIQQLDEQVSAYKSQIQVQLQRRADLVPNLVQTVKGYAQHEEEIFTAVAEARAKLGGALQSGDLQQMAAANQGLTGALGRLIAISENYPQLKANENFRMLQDQLEGTENRIATAREDYNNAVRSYNAYIRQFPQVLTAKVIGSKERQYFELTTPQAAEAPKVEFRK